MRFEHRQIDEAGVSKLGGAVEDLEALSFWRAIFDPAVNLANDANVMLLAELANAQNLVGGVEVKLGAWRFAEVWLRASGARLIRDCGDQVKVGRRACARRSASHKIRLEDDLLATCQDGFHAAK